MPLVPPAIANPFYTAVIAAVIMPAHDSAVTGR
jgi:hypothetical protein